MSRTQGEVREGSIRSGAEGLYLHSTRHGYSRDMVAMIRMDFLYPAAVTGTFMRSL